MTPTEAVARLLAKEAWGYDCWAEEMPEGMRDGYLRRAEMLVRAADAARPMEPAADDWLPISQWKPEHGDEVLGYWQYRDQDEQLTKGWNVLLRDDEEGFLDPEGRTPEGLYTHFRLLTRPREVTP